MNHLTRRRFLTILAFSLIDTRALGVDFNTDPAALNQTDRETLQRELKQGGFYTGTIDGDFGPGSRAAWQTAIRAHRVGPILPDLTLTDGVRAEYARLWSLAEILPEHRADVTYAMHRLLVGRPRYEAVQAMTRVPWHIIGLLHMRECDFSFVQHLHNGDPLTARTVHVPAGRPQTGRAPFDWSYSATDALLCDHFTLWTDWSLAGLLWKLEGYNGFGCRRHGRPTCYLWSMTGANVGGKYVADGVWNPVAVDEEPGCAAVLKALMECGAVTF